MEVVRLGRKGQVTIPKGILRALGVPGDTTMLVETTDEGAIVLRPAAVVPMEIYSAARVAEFERENTAPAETLRKVEKRLDETS